MQAAQPRKQDRLCREIAEKHSSGCGWGNASLQKLELSSRLRPELLCERGARIQYLPMPAASKQHTCNCSRKGQQDARGIKRKEFKVGSTIDSETSQSELN